MASVSDFEYAQWLFKKTTTRPPHATFGRTVPVPLRPPPPPSRARSIAPHAQSTGSREQPSRESSGKDQVHMHPFAAVLVKRVLPLMLLIFFVAGLVHACQWKNGETEAEKQEASKQETRVPAVTAMSAQLVVEMWHIMMAWSKLDHLHSRMSQLVALCVCVYCTKHAYWICRWCVLNIYECCKYLDIEQKPHEFGSKTPVSTSALLVVYAATFALLLLGVMVQGQGMDAPEESSAEQENGN